MDFTSESQRDPPAFATSVLGLQVHTTTSDTFDKGLGREAQVLILRSEL